MSPPHVMGVCVCEFVSKGDCKKKDSAQTASPKITLSVCGKSWLHNIGLHFPECGVYCCRFTPEKCEKSWDVWMPSAEVTCFIFGHKDASGEEIN